MRACAAHRRVSRARAPRARAQSVHFPGRARPTSVRRTESRGSGDKTELDCFSIQAALRPETRRLYGVTPARLRKVVSGGARGGDARGCGDSRRRRRGQRLGEPVAEGRARATALPRPFFSETTIDGARLAS